MVSEKKPAESESERREIERLNAMHREFMAAVGSGKIRGDVVDDPPRVDRRTDREIADGVAPYYD